MPWCRPSVPGVVHQALLDAQTHPRPVPRRQRGAARLDRTRRLGVRDRVRGDGGGGGARAARAGVRRTRHGRHRAARRPGDRGGRESAPPLSHRRERAAGRRKPPARGRLPQPGEVRERAEPGARAAARPYPKPFEAIRKTACSFGWDWGISTATSGIWRPVRLASWSTARLGDGSCTPSRSGDGGVVTVTSQLARAADDDLVLEVERRPERRRASSCRAGAAEAVGAGRAARGGALVAGRLRRPAAVRRRRPAERATASDSTRPPAASGSARCAGTPTRMPRAARSS